MGNRNRDDRSSARTTRRGFLKAVGAGAACIALGGALGCEQAERTRASGARPVGLQHPWTFRSRPDLRPPAVKVTAQAQDTAAGYIFVAPKKGPLQYGAMILDDRGDLVWFHPLQDRDEYAMDFKVQRFGGEPVLTWAQGRVEAGHGLDEYVIADSSYQEIARVRAGNGYKGDHHEFLISPNDTALITIYGSTPADLSSLGGPKNGKVLDGIVQELDIQSGEVLFEWHSLDHIGLEDSYHKPPKNPEWAFDYFHINSIDVDYDSNLLVSAKGTFTVYKIDRKSGEIMWRLGGKESDFEMGPGTRTAWQHDARRQRDGTITIFDNGAAPKVHDQSRGIVLELDDDQMSATLVREYTHPGKLLSISQGNVQVLPNGNVFIGWGSQPYFSEFSKDGELLFDARVLDKAESYRAFRLPWSGQPKDDPAVAAERGSDDKLTLYASWNGATEIASWQALAGPGPGRLEPVGAAAPREAFETAIAVDTAEAYVGVQARDRSDRVLGTSKPIKA